MDCSFTIDFSTGANSLTDTMKTKILANEGTFDGNDVSGVFTVPTPIGQVEGNYSITAQQITFDITEKPFFLPCGQIENYVKTNLIPA